MCVYVCKFVCISVYIVYTCMCVLFSSVCMCEY